jgi:hypothetical protein
MNRNLPNNLTLNTNEVKIFLISVFIVFAWFYIQGDAGIGLADEGYLWHNAQQTLNGRVPVRDFRSYDPGRYYWIAIWFKITEDDGLLSLRFACALFQLIGLFCGLLVMKRIINSWGLLILIGILLTLCMSPRHKYFEIALSLIALLFAVRLIEEPTSFRHFAAGCVTAIAAFIGKNFGVYFLTSFIFLIVFIRFNTKNHPFWHSIGLFGIGLLVGYLPELYLLLFIPGFFNSFFDSILRLFSPYAPVKSLPIPWPWKLNETELPTMEYLKRLISSLSYVIAFAFYTLGAVLVFIFNKKSIQSAPVFIASVFIGIPLLHHINFRAGISHFTQGIQPLLIGLIGLAVVLRTRQRFRFAIIITVIAFGLVSANLIFSKEMTIARNKLRIFPSMNSSLVKFPIKNDNIQLPKETANYLANLKLFFKNHMHSDENILIAPFVPGLYCVLEKQSPIWDAYPIHMAPVSEQNLSIRDMELKNVNWAIISDRALDGISERRFSETHAIIWEYVNREFNQENIPGIPEDLLVFRRKMQRTSNLSNS